MSPLLKVASAARTVMIDVLAGGGDVLVLAPHPDDESLGCGAAIAALSALGRRAQVVVVTDGGHSHPASRSTPPASLRRLRAAEVTRAVEILTVARGAAPVLLGYRDGAAPDGDVAADAAIARILSHIRASKTAIWSSWGGDPHVDHARTARLAARLVARTRRSRCGPIRSGGASIRTLRLSAPMRSCSSRPVPGRRARPPPSRRMSRR